MKTKAKYTAFLGLFLAFAVAAGYAERVIPPIIPALPGIKLGLPNIAAVVLMYIKDNKTALTLNALRVILSGLFFSGAWGAVYGLFGALLSFAAMAALKKTGIFGIAGASAAGGVFHNLGQICAAALITGDAKIFYYFPILIISGVVTGMIIGYLSGLVINRLGKSYESLF